MTDATITPIRRDAPYSDTAALNDIHHLLTSTDPGEETLADIAAIVARTGRPLVPARDIETTCTETVLGPAPASRPRARCCRIGLKS